MSMAEAMVTRVITGTHSESPDSASSDFWKNGPPGEVTKTISVVMAKKPDTISLRCLTQAPTIDATTTKVINITYKAVPGPAEGIRPDITKESIKRRE